MSPVERKAVGERMKAYWAKRRAEKPETAKESMATPKRKSGMSAEARQRQAERMRAYWAERREEKAGSADGGQAEAAAADSSGTSTRKASPKRRNK